MHTVWIAVIFGSGIPLLYLLAAAILLITNISQRRELASMCSHSVRYAGRNSARLPKLILGGPGAAGGCLRNTLHRSSGG
jgi:hypothetical protein